MANFRPAGASDEDSDSDDYGFYEKPVSYAWLYKPGFLSGLLYNPVYLGT